MRIALFANSKSGAGDAGGVAALLERADATVEQLDFDEVCSGELTALPGIDRLVVAGGDGSLGPAARLALTAGVPLAVIPAGTANSFARWLELPLDIEQAARLATAATVSTTRVEVATADERPFVNLASVGLPVTAAHRARAFKRALGPLAYAVGAVRAGLSGRALRAGVYDHGQEVWAGKAWQISVAVTGAFGGESGVGGVDVADGLLDVAIIPASSRAALVRHAWAMRRERLVFEDDVLHARAGEVTLALPPGTEWNIDGETIALERARFAVLGTVDVVKGAS